MTSEAIEFVSDPVRVAYPSLFEPRAFKGGSGRATYQMVALIPPDASLRPWAEAMRAAMAKKFGPEFKLPAAKNPIRLCEEKPVYSAFAGWRYVNLSNGFQPGVVDERMTPISDPDRVYAGCWARVHANAWAWAHPQGGKGVSFNVNAVQFVRHDERLVGQGAVDPSRVFTPLDVVAGDGTTPAAAPAPVADEIADLFG